jgi:hypothetical protein
MRMTSFPSNNNYPKNQFFREATKIPQFKECPQNVGGKVPAFDRET